MNDHAERVTAVFEAAVLLEPAERLSFVREACADDLALRREVESMLTDLDQPLMIPGVRAAVHRTGTTGDGVDRRWWATDVGS